MSKSQRFGGNAIDHPWLRPLWVRLLIVLLCALWCGLETYNNQPFWATIAAGAAGYAAWFYVITWKGGAKPDAVEPRDAAGSDGKEAGE